MSELGLRHYVDRLAVADPLHSARTFDEQRVTGIYAGYAFELCAGHRAGQTDRDVHLVALMVTTGWSVLAGDTWPPETYQEFSPTGTWTYQDRSGAVVILTMGPVDPKTGAGSGMTTPVSMDATLGGLFPEATSLSHGFGAYVATAPNTYRTRGINYVLKDSKSKPVILGMLVWEGTATLPTADTVDLAWDKYFIYSAAADKDSDGLPDPNEPPLVSLPPFQAKMTRL